MTKECSNFEPDTVKRAKDDYGVLVYIEIDGRFAVDVDLGKRYLAAAFTEKGDMKRTKQLRHLIKTWIEEDKLLEEIEGAPQPKTQGASRGPVR